MDGRAGDLGVVRRIGDGTLTVLSVVVALWAAFGTFGTALWTNIHVDGRPDDSTVETMAAVAPLACLFLLPPVALVLLVRVSQLSSVQRVFQMVGVPSLVLFTFGYGLAPILGLSFLWAVPLSLSRRKLAMPPLDVILVVSYWLLFAFFAYTESHR